MSINTKQVTERREVRYESFDDLLQDAERLASGEVTTAGNWSFGQILEHLARAFHMTIDGANFGLPSPVQWALRTFMMKRFLRDGITPGFTIPKNARTTLLPAPVETEDGLRQLRDAVSRLKQESQRSINPVLGKITPDQSDTFQLRHAEMHMSFVKPVL